MLGIQGRSGCAAHWRVSLRSRSASPRCRAGHRRKDRRRSRRAIPGRRPCRSRARPRGRRSTACSTTPCGRTRRASTISIRSIPSSTREPSERTEIYLLYDDDALYIAARMFTPPGELTANIMRQGASITQEDSLFVTLDPFNTRRGGYFFGLNAHGVRFDGLYRNVSEYYSDWDSIWFAAATRVRRAAGRPSTRSRSSRCRSIRTATRGGSISRAASRRATRTWRGSRAIGAGTRAPRAS